MSVLNGSSLCEKTMRANLTRAEPITFDSYRQILNVTYRNGFS